jgi:hypothetical protein
MSKFWHAAGHVVLIGLGIAAQYGGLVPGPYAPLALAVQGLAQAILALTQHKPKSQ